MDCLLDELYEQIDELKDQINDLLIICDELKHTDNESTRQEKSADYNEKMTDVECQTDEQLLYNYAWEKYYNYFSSITTISTSKQQQQQQQLTEQASTSTATTSHQTSDNEIMNADMIKQIAQETLESNGFQFDVNTGLYYDNKSKLYYNPENRLYLDMNNGIYYVYDDDDTIFKYHSKIDPKLWKAMKKAIASSSTSKSSIIYDNDGCVTSKLIRATTVNRDDYESDSNSTITIDSKSSTEINKIDNNVAIVSDNDNESIDFDIEDLSTKYPPCIRAIVTKSDTLDIGSLFIIPYTGGNIGSDCSNCLFDLIDDNVSKLHASIKYDLDKKQYLLKDEESTSGTYLNNVYIEKKKEHEIKHGDLLRISNTELLLHIHNGINTCNNCEPGEVMAKTSKLTTDKVCNYNKEETRRKANKEIRKKFGLVSDKYKDKINLNPEYKDRAQERRETVGVDLSHIDESMNAHTDTSVASVNVAIGESNVGRKMLEKMGWKEGKGLGKAQAGITEPIKTAIRVDRTGLGSGNTGELSLDSSETHKKKLINWNKTNQRFQMASSKTHAAFNVDDDDGCKEEEDDSVTEINDSEDNETNKANKKQKNM